MRDYLTKIEIDFFELCFLAEACIPPRPIARMSFWDRLINEIYHKLTRDERKQMYDWMLKSFNFEAWPELQKNDDIRLFINRFNPWNQYLITYKKGNSDETFQLECFLHEGEYRIKSNKWIDSSYIISKTKLLEIEGKVEPKDSISL